MALINTPTNQITEAVLTGLIGNVPEGKTIDYKRALPDGSDGSRKEFAADVASFANADGGHIVFGMAEKEGLPTELVPLDVNPDREILRLENIALDGIRPRITGLEIVRVPLAAGGVAIVCSVPKSWNPPHQVILQKDYRFYTRGSAGKQHLDVDALKRVISFSQELGERIRQFRAARIAAVRAGDTPVPLSPGARIIIHFVPFVSFSPGSNLDIRGLAASRIELDPFIEGGSQRLNIDGLVGYSHANEGHRAYAQLYRSGILETVEVYRPRHEPKQFPSLSFERDVHQKMKAAQRLLMKIDMPKPVAVLLTLTGLKGWHMATRDDWIRGSPGGFDRDDILVPEVVWESFDEDALASSFRELIDTAWQAAGFDGSDNFTADGRWNPK